MNIRCAGHMVRLATRVAVADAQLHDERAGELPGRATSTVSIMRDPPAGR